MLRKLKYALIAAGAFTLLSGYAYYVWRKSRIPLKFIGPIKPLDLAIDVAPSPTSTFIERNSNVYNHYSFE